MRSERLTFLVTDQEKRDIRMSATSRGLTSSEYVRLAVDNFERTASGEKAALQAAIERTAMRMDALHAEMQAFFRAKSANAVSNSDHRTGSAQ